MHTQTPYFGITNSLSNFQTHLEYDIFKDILMVCKILKKLLAYQVAKDIKHNFRLDVL